MQRVGMNKNQIPTPVYQKMKIRAKLNNRRK
jgi:hypothetical protein